MIHTEVELFIIIWLNYSIRCIYSVYIFFFSCICINYSVLWRISTRWESATGISNRKIFCSTRNLAFLSSVILVPPNIWSKGSPMCLTSVVVTIARPNWSLVLLIILQKSVCLSLLIEFRLKFLSRFLSIYRDIVIIRLIGLLSKIQIFFFFLHIRTKSTRVYRCLERRLCSGRIIARPTDIPRGQWSGSIGRDHQGARHPDAWPDTWDEPQLHRVQIPTN